MQLYSARNFTPWDKVFETASTLGYSEVEGFGDLYEEPAKTRTLLETHKLTMSSGHFSLDDLENSLESTLSVASVIGITQIFCPYIEEELRPVDLAGWQELARRLTAINKNLADNGLRFGWHNHDFEFSTCADGSIPMRTLLETAPDMDWEIDVAWVARAGSDPSSWIAEFGSRITAVHVKDLAQKGDCIDEDGWADVGYGVMDWKMLMQQVLSSTNTELIVAEHDNPNDLRRFAERSLQSIKSFT